MKYHNGLQNYKYASENWPDEEKIVFTELYVKTETDFTRIDRQMINQTRQGTPAKEWHFGGKI